MFICTAIWASFDILLSTLIRMCGEQNYVSRLAALWTETVFWGLYVAVFSGCVYVLMQRRDIPRLFLPTSIIMFLICSTFLIIDFVVVLLDRDVVSNTFCVGLSCISCTTETQTHLDEVLLENLTDPVQQALFATNLFLADGLLIYRCFVIWKQARWGKWVVFLPILLLLASSATTYAQVHSGVQIWQIRRDTPLSVAIPPPDWFSANDLYNKLSIAAFILSLATTVLTTFLIASRIWWSTREVEEGVGQGKPMYRKSMTLVIESGAMYSVSLIVMVAVWFTAPLYMPIPEYAMRQIMGIAPTLIIVRLGLGKGVESIIQELSASRMSEVLAPASRGLRFGQWPDVESHHDSHLIRQKPSSDETEDGPMSVEDVSVSDRVPGFPPMECAELHGFNTYAHSRSGSE